MFGGLFSEAFELVNGKEVVVMSSVGPWESVGGDIKFLRLMQNKVRAPPPPSPSHPPRPAPLRRYQPCAPIASRNSPHNQKRLNSRRPKVFYRQPYDYYNL